ncbi:5-formyltetrahydrofolate cyclo-ligase [Olsenella sp. YH-ols2217]|uniref:5-formyltetrahydrofolate cyclo-ligase n=1 Tax=Kribbibacterium absianum TaxID=3044210 RepID=A0ABT6ZLL7_9ACTN|nr:MULTISPECIES: 5-formyltetrahydrofolate cyclo-ligase [unclassified Olsenella]MDJ1121932.1 5-formyltetrahydrofolate cyclo-ligase [Olsenella sp. YH-ols2216]MDJ1129940.1 5-formyltetrahydrofolate cyclo-ligase [Olsenella sp. YH-ols2217]
MGNPDIDARKKELRRRLKVLRHDLGAEKRAVADGAIANKVAALDVWRDAPVVLVYLSVGDEVDTRVLIARAWERGKRVAVPRVTGPRQMEWRVIEDFEALERTRMGVVQPLPDACPRIDGACVDEKAVALVPGLAFDRAGYRIGYGGGFFDAFLGRFVGTSVGLCRSVALVDDLGELGVLDVCDVAADLVISG